MASVIGFVAPGVGQQLRINSFGSRSSLSSQIPPRNPAAGAAVRGTKRANVPLRRAAVRMGMEAAAHSEELRVRGRNLSRTGWLAWWIELPLTVTTAFILGFALLTKGPGLSSSVAAALALGVVGAISCFVSVLFAWGYAALGRRMIEGDENPPLLRTVQIGLYIAVFGLICALLGVQAIVGTTLGKALATGLTTSAVQNQSAVAALDLLIIQGCVNALMSQFVALITALNLLLRIRSQQRKAE